MKLVALASLLVVAAISFVLAGTPAITTADNHAPACAACAEPDKGEACCGTDRHARQSHQWEYKCVRPSKKPDAMTSQFNGLGAEGWKLKQADGGFWCFARKK